MQEQDSTGAAVCKSGVYYIRNRFNGKVYVGSGTYSARKRLSWHQWALRKNRHSNIHLQRAWNKDGEKAFVFNVMESCPPEKCLEREQYWIDTFQAADQEYGYNIRKEASSNRGIPMSQRTREAIRKATVGRKMNARTRMALAKSRTGSEHSPETRRKMAASHRGVKLSEEHRQAISEGHKGIVKDARWLKRMSDSQKGRPLTEEHKAKLKEAAIRRWAREKARREAETGCS
jgi:group I intron endonuclease